MKYNQKVDWLKKCPTVLTRTGLQDLSNGYKAFLKGKRGYPNFKSKHKSKKSFAVELTKSHFSKEAYFQFKQGL